MPSRPNENVIFERSEDLRRLAWGPCLGVWLAPISVVDHLSADQLAQFQSEMVETHLPAYPA